MKFHTKDIWNHFPIIICVHISHQFRSYINIKFSANLLHHKESANISPENIPKFTNLIVSNTEEVNYTFTLKEDNLPKFTNPLLSNIEEVN